MSSQGRPLLRFLKARLSKRISIWILASIFLIELIILVPSVYRRKQELLQQLAMVSSGKVAWIIATYPYQSQAELLKQLIHLNQLDDPVLGGALYQLPDGKLIGEFGEPPQLSFSQARQGDSLYLNTASGDRYDFACNLDSLKDNYLVVVRHDADQITQEVRFFIVRIAGLVLIISFFVVIGTMIVLEKMVITPILNLRLDLIKAGKSIYQNQEPPQFYSASIQRSDELGDVISAFMQMFDQIHQAITSRQKAEDALRVEKEKSEQLLLNILPQAIAEQLKQQPGLIADRFEQATILFADITDFTGLASQISPTELVSLLNQIFSSFDRLAERHGLEKIKTIGDAYMVVGGLPKPRQDHAEAIAQMALDMQQEIYRFKREDNKILNLRIGINTGPVVAGVIGLKKFSYDLWGDAVNIASRMESHGKVGEIHVTEATYELLKHQYVLEKRGIVQVKGRGEMTTYWLKSRKPASVESQVLT
ncbi:adenylate/guanylate cyclase domain-containing protein [Limnoraphis robusta Tam1]|nr:adenylate/guanylate cyclase domain-containing protein [Limnoraphis robusta]MEA5538263.1 adenylate/guanylate cyclase domain-containing protein [Limnoraphis robusta Tam1]